MNQVDRPGHVRVDHVAHFLEVLIKECMTETAPCIGQQRRYRPATDFFVEVVDALDGRQVRLDHIDLSTFPPKGRRRILKLRFIGSNKEVKTVLGALPGQFKPNSRGRASYDCEL